MNETFARVSRAYRAARQGSGVSLVSLRSSTPLARETVSIILLPLARRHRWWRRHRRAFLRVTSHDGLIIAITCDSRFDDNAESASADVVERHFYYIETCCLRARGGRLGNARCQKVAVSMLEQLATRARKYSRYASVQTAPDIFRTDGQVVKDRYRW